MSAPDFWETPETAIHAFEALTELHLTVHDLTVPLWPYLPPERFKHRSPCCLAVKTTHDWACMDFEITRLRNEILKYPDGRCHQCHAGFVEWVVPVFIGGQLAWVLFAGQARSGGSYRRLIRDIRTTHLHRQSFPQLAAVPEARSALILEALRQLRSRLLEWHSSMHPRSSSPSRNRTNTIRTFLLDKHAEDPSIRDLARHIGLGESRTIHLVKELFGCGFSRLLNQMRLKTASSLLRNTSLSVQEICYASGFKDLSHFHRIFLRHFKATPLQYRKTAGS